MRGKLEVEAYEGCGPWRTAPERVRQEARDDTVDLETGGVEMFLDRSMGERKGVVGAVEVVPSAVAKLGPRTAILPPGSIASSMWRRNTATSSWVAKCSRRFDTNTGVEVGIRQFHRTGIADDDLDRRVEEGLVVLDRVHHPSLRSGDGLDELAPPRRRVQYASGTAEPLVDGGTDLVPHELTGVLRRYHGTGTGTDADSRCRPREVGSSTSRGW